MDGEVRIHAVLVEDLLDYGSTGEVVQSWEARLSKPRACAGTNKVVFTTTRFTSTRKHVPQRTLTC